MKNKILWFLLIILIILIIGYSVFYIIFKRKETSPIIPEINEQIKAENNEMWLFVRSTATEKDGTKSNNLINLYCFIFHDDRIDVYYNDEKMITKNYKFTNNELHIIDENEVIIKFEITKEEEFIVLSEEIEGITITYYFIKSED